MALFGKPGPTGPAGQQGIQGVQGATGPKGADGLPGDAFSFPIGAVYISTVNENPAAKVGGGTWMLMESGEFSTTTPTCYLWRRTL
jgi:hypothetical protein